VKGYTKSKSFFDDISCETSEKILEKAAGRSSNRLTKEERDAVQKVDMDTFGAELVQSYNRSGHRERGRGFRRRY